jgi:hypothetical protein
LLFKLVDRVDDLTSEAVKQSQSPDPFTQNPVLQSTEVLVAQLDIVIVGMEFVLKYVRIPLP